MILKCWKCKSADGQSLDPNKVETLLAKVLPLAPYECSSCGGKYYGLTDPLFDRSRIIAAGVMSGLLVVTLILSIGSSPETPSPEEPPAETPTETAEASNPPAEEPAAVADAAEPATENQEAAPEAPIPVPDPKPAGPKEVPPSVLATDPPESKPEEGEVWSNRVQQQVALNLKKLRGQKLEAPSIKEDPQAAKKKPPQKNTAKTQPAQPKTTTPAASAQTKAQPATTLEDPQDTKPTTPTAQLHSMVAQAEGTTYTIRVNSDGPIATYRSYASGAKHVVELRGNWQVDRGFKDLAANHALVKAVRVGRHSDHVRLVLDLNGPAQISVDDEPSGLKIQVKPRSP